jgi:hypothetical protein
MYTITIYSFNFPWLVFCLLSDKREEDKKIKDREMFFRGSSRYVNSFVFDDYAFALYINGLTVALISMYICFRGLVLVLIICIKITANSFCKS